MYKNKPICVNISRDLSKKLDVRCEAECRTKTRVVNRLVKMWLNKEITIEWEK